MPKWQYTGDLDLKEGGFFWLDEGDDDCVQAVVVTPCSSAGGPDNLFHIEVGSIYFARDKYADYLSVIGMEPEQATREDVIYAAQAYAGIERDHETVVRIGKDERATDPWRWKETGWNPEPDVVLRGNASLQRWVEREYLS